LVPKPHYPSARKHCPHRRGFLHVPRTQDTNDHRVYQYENRIPNQTAEEKHRDSCQAEKCRRQEGNNYAEGNRSDTQPPDVVQRDSAKRASIRSLAFNLFVREVLKTRRTKRLTPLRIHLHCTRYTPGPVLYRSFGRENLSRFIFERPRSRVTGQVVFEPEFHLSGFRVNRDLDTSFPSFGSSSIRSGERLSD
jgi:hypothetical protein